MRPCLWISLLCWLVMPVVAETRQEARPNFLIIVADDLGFSDLGAFGGEIDTPHLDALIQGGLQLTNFHASPTCSPTRAMLLTGLDNHEAGLGSMAETLAPNQKGQRGYEGVLREDNATLAELLSAEGYRTHFAGKWHLGMAPEQAPHSRGFQSSFVMLEGMHNHFGYDMAGNGVGHPRTYLKNGERIASLPEDFYSSDFFADSLIEQLRAARAEAEGNRPFLAYLAFTAPHWPLHAPAETIAKYKGRYDEGYDALGKRRYRRLVELGLIGESAVPHDLDLARRWETLSPEQQAMSARLMEVYAAMVDRMDHNVGRVIEALRETGELDNTYIFFLSDNGAEAADVTSLPSDPGSTSLQQSPARFLGIEGADNSLDNIGSRTSFASLGPGWAGAASTPFWRVKAYQTEGGTRVASFLSGPGIEPRQGSTFTSVMDVVPTLLELAGLSPPGSEFAGRSIRPLRGKSWGPWLRGERNDVYGPAEVVGFELFGGRGVRQGNWKLLDTGDGQWRLFDVGSDPGETRDLSAEEPERKTALLAAWEAYAEDVGVVMPDAPRPIVNRPLQR